MNEFESKDNLSEEPVEETVDSALDIISQERTAESEETLEAVDETVEESVSGENEAPKVSEKAKKSGVATFYEYLETFCYALAVMMVLFLFVFRYVTVDGDSMKHTLHNNDKLIISNLFYTPETGDIVVINPEIYGSDPHPIIKRVIATEGQKVLIDYENWAVYVDGVKLDEPYIEPMKAEDLALAQKMGYNDIKMNGTTIDEFKTEFTVAEGKVFVMGDNRNHSKDSRDRDFGFMGENRIIGRVIIRLTPDFGFVE